MVNKLAPSILLLLIAAVLAGGDIADSAYSGPPKIIAELGLAQMPDTLTFTRSADAALLYRWSVMLRVFADSSKVPDVLGLSLKCRQLPGDGEFSAPVLKTCEWMLERLGKERTFYRFGDLELTATDSSYTMTAPLSPSYLANIDSVQVYAVTDLLSPEGFILRDMSDYGQPGEDIRDPVGEGDARFDISFVRAKILGLPNKK